MKTKNLVQLMYKQMSSASSTLTSTDVSIRIQSTQPTADEFMEHGADWNCEWMRSSRSALRLYNSWITTHKGSRSFVTTDSIVSGAMIRHKLADATKPKHGWFCEVINQATGFIPEDISVYQLYYCTNINDENDDLSVQTLRALNNVQHVITFYKGVWLESKRGKYGLTKRDTLDAKWAKWKGIVVIGRPPSCFFR